MRVKCYACEKDKMLFVVMPTSSAPGSLPKEVGAATGALSLFKEFELSEATPRIAINVEKALTDIAAKGHHVVKVQILFEETTRSGELPRS